MSFADDLRKATQEACDRDLEQMRAERARKEAEQNARRLAEEARAEGIIAGIEGKCKEAAANRKFDAFIMHLDPYEFHGGEKDIDPPRDRNASRVHLSYAAGLVYDHMKNVLGLTPVIKWNHDGVGIKDWYELWATWRNE